MIRLVLAWLIVTGPAYAEALVAVRTIPAQTVLGPEDVTIKDIVVAGALQDPDQVIGQEARVALFAGRPIRATEVGPPAVVERNDVIMLIYAAHGLTIRTEGRALDRAGPGDRIRVMNLASRNTITAVIDELGVAHVAP